MERDIGAVGETAELARPTWPERSLEALTAVIALAALLGLHGQLGPLSFTLRRLGALAILALIAAARTAVGSTWRLGGSIGVVAALALVIWAPSVPIVLVGFGIALAALESACVQAESGAERPGCLAESCLTYVALSFAIELVPQTRTIADSVTDCANRYIHRVLGFDIHPSFTALGGPAIVLAVLYLFGSWRRDGGAGRLVAASTLPIAWFALLPFITPDASGGPLTVFSWGAGYGLVWLAVAGLAAALLPHRQRVSRFSRPVTAHKLPLAAADIAAALAGVCLVGTGLIGPVAGRSIRVHNYGGLDWDRPVYGRFGTFTGGMFGLLPVYCRAEGYDFDVIEHFQETASDGTPRSRNGSNAAPPRTESASIKAHADPPSISEAGLGGAMSVGRPARRSPAWIPAILGSAGASAAIVAPSANVAPRPTDTIEPADLDTTQILVLINSPKLWDDGQRRAVLDFVARGGSLLVLGDHTDVFGLMRGFNSLLRPLGIKFRFDSAYKARKTWRGCQAAAADFVAWGWDDENPGVAVGASLELSGSARPLLVGRYAFSDSGMRENTIGSFLGNYHYDRGERLGDVVLVATVTHGRGRIVVWGDTSPFQGGLSTRYHTVIGPMLAWLSRPAAWTEMSAVRVAAAIALLAALLWIWIVPITVKQLAVMAVSLLLGLAVPWALSLRIVAGSPHADRHAVLIDRSHMEATGHYEARVNPIGPLYTNMQRSGFRIIDMEAWDSAAIARARGIAFVAPQRSFSRGEVADLLNAEEGGTVVLLTVGQPDSAGSQRLLEAHGLALVPRPLGTVTAAEPGASRRERERKPRFLDAWPIVAASDEGDPVALPGIQVIYKQGKDTIALFRRTGRGGLVLISDTRFFSDMNVEDMAGYWQGNLALIHDIFERYLGADADAVKPLFRSPEKPQ